ncbi:MAG: Universal bacterial protein glycoprotease YeaZ [Thermoanaerobacterales bacterium 50_218]|nr:MAG: Universal bacterial protein glycoprotease YeaZ [Thermoanaerobacterales bacterium 50_218]
MRLLGIETSTPVVSVAVGDERKILGEVSLSAEQAHMERLLPLIDFLLNCLGLELKDLDGFAVAVGPGSFTSLRIGLATGKAFAHASGKPLVGVPTLDVLAAALQGCEGIICPVLRARRQEVYTAFYVSTPSGVKRLSSYLALDPEEMVARLEANLEAGITFIGEGASHYWDLFREKLGEKAHLADPALMWPRAGLVVSLGLQLLPLAPDDPGKVEALYVRPPAIRKN